MLWGGVVGNHNADCVPRLHSQQKAPAGGMGHGATWFSQLPNLIYGYNGLPIFFFFKLDSACLSSKCPGHCAGDQGSLLEPHSALHIKIPVVNAVQGTGLFTLGEDFYTWQTFLVHTPRAIFLSTGLICDSLNTQYLHEAKEASDNVKVSASFKVSSRRARIPFILPVWFKMRPKEHLRIWRANHASIFRFALVMKCP